MDLGHCTPVLFVKDVTKSVDFYAGVLGLTVVSDFGGLNFMFKEGKDIEAAANRMYMTSERLKQFLG